MLLLVIRVALRLLDCQSRATTWILLDCLSFFNSLVAVIKRTFSTLIWIFACTILVVALSHINARAPTAVFHKRMAKSMAERCEPL